MESHSKPFIATNAAQKWLVAFMVVLLAEVVLHLIPSFARFTIFTKPLLMPLLLIWVHTCKYINNDPAAATHKLYPLLLRGIAS